jgi:type IV secretion system protein VirB4
MATASKASAAASREPLAAGNIPYAWHLTRDILQTHAGDYLCVLRLSGAAFECADDSAINSRHDRLNRILLSLADPRITLWQHVVRRVENQYPDGEFASGFAADLNAKYAAHVSDEALMANELYLTVIYRPQTAVAGRALARLLSGRDRKTIADERNEHVADLGAIIDGLVAALSFYEAERLSVYRRNEMLCSAPAELFGYLVNGRWERIVLAVVPLNRLIPTVRLFFGNDTIEVRGPVESSYSAMLGIHGYPAVTSPLYLSELLSVSCEVVVTQSFTFERQAAALHKLGTTGNVLLNAGDEAHSQIEELPNAADDLVSRRVAMGGHHYTVQVKGATLRELAHNVALVRTILTDAGIVSAREDLANEAAYWAQLPGNFKFRPRLSMINTRNVCGFMPLHNFPMGRRDGNHWGPALTMLITAAGTPHYLSLHASDPQTPNGGGKKDVAHALLLGPNGSGKTVLVMFLLCMLQKFGVTSVLFSKDRDTEITVRALGGVFYPIRLEEPTGWNPFSLDAGEAGDAGTIALLRRLVRKLVSRPLMTASGSEVDSTPLTISEEKDIDSAIAAVLRLDPDRRRLGRVLDYLPKGEGSVYERLSKWCYAREAGRPDGVNAWVFDNPGIDPLASTLGQARTTGFDITEFLDDAELRTPINMYLLHLTRRLVDGRRLAVFMSEFWKALGDQQFAAAIKDMLKTLRKQNGFTVLDSQSPSDALTHPISRTLIEQVATMFLFPNPGADCSEYMTGLGLSTREANLIKTDLPEGSGMFLLKQGRHSVVLELPLAGFDDELAVLSARTNNIALMDRLIAKYGAAPEQWLPHFYRERKVS